MLWGIFSFSHAHLKYKITAIILSITSKGPRYDISNEFVFLGSDTKNLSPGVNVPSLVILFAYSRCLCPDICKDSIPSLHATTILPLQSATYRYTIHLLFWFRDIFLHNHNHKHNFPVGKVPPLINIIVLLIVILEAWSTYIFQTWWLNLSIWYPWMILFVIVTYLNYVSEIRRIYLFQNYEHFLWHSIENRIH